MYFFYNEDGYLVPTYEISYVDGDLYKVQVSYADDGAVPDIKYILSKHIFKVDLKDLVQRVVGSMDIRHIGRSSGIITMYSLDNKRRSFYVYHGGLFDTELNNGMCTQILTPNNILKYRDLIAVTDVYSRYSRTLIIPRETDDVSMNIRNMSQTHHDIVRYIEDNGPATSHQIAEGLGINLNTISGRITELSHRGIITCYDYDTSSERRRSLWHLRPKNEWEGPRV